MSRSLALLLCLAATACAGRGAKAALPPLELERETAFQTCRRSLAASPGILKDFATAIASYDADGVELIAWNKSGSEFIRLACDADGASVLGLAQDGDDVERLGSLANGLLKRYDRHVRSEWLHTDAGDVELMTIRVPKRKLDAYAAKRRELVEALSGSGDRRFTGGGGGGDIVRVEARRTRRLSGD